MILDEIRTFGRQYAGQVEELGRKLRKQAMPVATKELFAEFETNGNRIRYEAVYFGRRRFLSVFGLLSVMYGRREDIDKLEEVLFSICEEECWALPAHVNRGQDENWRRTIDLFASETAQTLAQLTVLLSEKLSGQVKARVRQEVFSRVLEPFMASAAPYADWEQAYNNWNAVCCGNIGSAGLYLLEDTAARRTLAERVAYALKRYYIGSFGDDGACQEGLGYWVYGFTYYMLFAVQAQEEFPELGLLEGEKIRSIACFQQKCYFAGGRTISFSDGDCFGSYPMGLTCCLALYYPQVRFPDIAYVQMPGDDACWRWIGMYWSWYYTKRYLQTADSGQAVPQPVEDCGCTVLEDAQWSIVRGACASAVVSKGGNNGESHNHNDVGSFFYLLDGESFLEDLGSGEYTRDYFSDRRYEIFCNRGMSHNIPIIDGVDQRAGQEFRAAEFTVKDNEDTLIEFHDAYGVPGLRRLQRRIHLDQPTGSLCVCDELCTDRELAAEENLVTRLPAVIEKGRILLKGIRHEVLLEIAGLQGDISQTTVIHSDHSGNPQEVTCLRWKLAQAEPGRYCCRITAKII